MQTRRTQNRFPGPKSYRDFRKRAPVEHDINIKGFRKGSSMDYFSCIMWRHKNEISEIMGFVRIFWKNNFQEADLPKMSISGQIVSEIVAHQLCLENCIQTLLNCFGSTPQKIRRVWIEFWLPKRIFPLTFSFPSPWWHLKLPIIRHIFSRVCTERKLHQIYISCWDVC